MFAELEREGAAMLDRAGIAPAHRRFERFVDARYERQSYELSDRRCRRARSMPRILAEIAEAFHARHRATYGHDNRGEPVQLVSVRLTAIGEIPPLDVQATAPRRRHGPDQGPARGVVSPRRAQSRPTSTIGGACQPGSTAPGPAVIELLESTILVPPHWQARMTDDGFVASARTARAKRAVTMEGQQARSGDPATFEIVKNSFSKIAEEMRVVLAKTAYSPILKSAGDYSCGVFDAKGSMVAQGPDLPIHLGSMPDAVRAVVAAFGADVHDGDVFIHNDPYFGGSHLPDVNVVRPAFYDGRLLGYTCLRAHWPDVGSATPGSYGAVTEIYGEGLRLPPLRLVIQGRAQRRPREGDPRQRAYARRAQGRPRRPARRHPARHRAAQGAGRALRGRAARRLHGRGDGLLRDG